MDTRLGEPKDIKQLVSADEACVCSADSGRRAGGIDSGRNPSQTMYTAAGFNSPDMAEFGPVNDKDDSDASTTSLAATIGEPGGDADVREVTDAERDRAAAHPAAQLGVGAVSGAVPVVGAVGANDHNDPDLVVRPAPGVP